MWLESTLLDHDNAACLTPTITRPNRVVEAHRQAMVLLLEAEALIAWVATDEAAWGQLMPESPDDMCLERAKLVTFIPKVVHKSPVAEHKEEIRYDWMVGSNHKYDHFAQITVGEIVESLHAAVARLEETNHNRPSSPTLHQRATYFGDGFQSLAVMSIPVGCLAPTGEGDDPTPVVYAYKDSGSGVCYVTSNGRNIVASNILRFARMHLQDWEREIDFRQEIATVSIR